MFSYFRVQGRSMEPLCREGDFVLINKFVGFKEGDLAVIRHPISSRLLLKRVVQKKGEKYWFEGDNRGVSSDSRDFGWIERDSILGRAKVIHK